MTKDARAPQPSHTRAGTLHAGRTGCDADLFALLVRPNRRSPAPRHVYEAEAARWSTVWPELTVLPREDVASER